MPLSVYEKNSQTQFHTRNLFLTAPNLFFTDTETISTTMRYGFCS